MKNVLAVLCLCLLCCCKTDNAIDRFALVSRNNPKINAVDTLASLSVGNGEFAFTADITGLQTFPEAYSNGVPLGTQSQWGWHSFPNPENLRPEEFLKAHDFGHHGQSELYADEFKEEGRQKKSANWHRMNPHRLHLGVIGFEGLDINDISGIDQTLDLWNGEISSKFSCGGSSYRVKTVCHPKRDMIAAQVSSDTKASVKFRFPYPTGKHSDDACDWDADDKHDTDIVNQGNSRATLKRTIDDAVYYVNIAWSGEAELIERQKNYFVLKAKDKDLSFTCSFAKNLDENSYSSFEETEQSAAAYWQEFWTKGAAVDFSHCTDLRARELERRVVLSQYLLAIQSAGSTPPQETGLTYNSWFGKFHLEMIWWHQAWQALWGHEELLQRTMQWYEQAEGKAREIAHRQGFEGIRWMKMTDPGAEEAPSNVGSFLIWQQPHYIYLAELIYRANPSDSILDKYCHLVQETAKFMYSFASYDDANDRYVLKGIIPAQETLKAAETVNPPLELSYWLFGLQTAQAWRERMGEPRNVQWDVVIDKLSPLAYNDEGLYLAAETAADTYSDIRFTSDHPAVLGSVGMLPMNRLIDKRIMTNTLKWIGDNWNWDQTWGWDYPMTAMNAARMNLPEMAVSALLMDKRTNTFLPNGHNYQDNRLRIYLPGNGGLLTAIALMCAGWDGCDIRNPGFPNDGKWDVRWEGLKALP